MMLHLGSFCLKGAPRSSRCTAARPVDPALSHQLRCLFKVAATASEVCRSDKSMQAQSASWREKLGHLAKSISVCISHRKARLNADSQFPFPHQISMWFLKNSIFNAASYCSKINAFDQWMYRFEFLYISFNVFMMLQYWFVTQSIHFFFRR